MASNGNNSPRKPSNGIWQMVLGSLLFIAVIALILYYTVFLPNQTPSADRAHTFNDSQLVMHDEDGNGIPDKDSNGHSVEGSFADFLYTADVKTLQVIQSNQSDNIYYVQGTYADGTTVRSYVGQISKNSYELIDNYIVRERKDSQGNAYYDTTRYLFSIESTNSFLSWLPTIIYVLMIVVFFYFLFRMLRSSAGGQSQIMSFNKSRATRVTASKVRFSDVAGCDEAKDELRDVVGYFHNVDKYTKMGAKLPHGILLVGPPGTGKTLLAKAVAGEASVPFFSISGSDFVEMYVGVGAGRVRDMFNTAKKNAPCLIFIDEIDAVGRQRGAGLGGGNDEREQTLNQLLVEMDGFESNSGIMVMAATNREDVLDPALLRPGRFDLTITVDLPDKAGREAILKVHARNKPMAKDVDFASVAARTVGFSGADLAEVLNDAAILAVRNHEDAITMPDIDESIDRRIAGPAKKTHMDPSDKKQVAFHEAGHAIIGLTLPDADKVQAVSIIPRGRTGGHTLMAPDRDRFLYTKKMLLARITGYLGGRVSEEVFFGDVSTGASDDFQKATQIARSMVTEYGMSTLGPVQYENPNQDVFLGRDYNSQRNYSAQVGYEIDKAERAIIEECYQDAKRIITERRDDVTLIANALIEKETINAAEIKYLLEHRELPHYENHVDKTEAADPFQGYQPKNPHSITLIPEYHEFYREVDDLLAHGFEHIVLVMAAPDGNPLPVEAFFEKVRETFSDPKVGILCFDADRLKGISSAPALIGQHLEKYSGKNVLLVTCDSASVDAIQDKVQSL